jgi:hypothetical protein
MNAAERLERDDNCFMGMAMNPAWDIRNLGAEMIADADANRLMHIEIGLPPEDIERAIIAKAVSRDDWKISGPQLDMVMGIAKDIRSVIKEGTLSGISWAIRPQIKVARALRWWQPTNAYKKAVADYLDPETRQVLLDIVRTHHDEGSSGMPF